MTDQEQEILETGEMTDELRRNLRLMVRSSYDLQQLRVQTGLRLCASFRAKLAPEGIENKSNLSTEELDEDATKLIDQLKESYKNLTTGIARNRTIPTERGFKGNDLITNYTELVLVDQYLVLERQELRQFAQFTTTLEKLPIYSRYLKGVRGVGPALAAVLITYIDINKAKYPSSIWMYCGLDVAPDGWGRSKRQAHLVQREYINAKGEPDTRLSTTFNPWLKAKLLGVLGPSFLRTNSPWRAQFDNYKNRILTDPARIKVTSPEWSKLYAQSKTDTSIDMKIYWSPLRIRNAAVRYMVKMFLIEFYQQWRAMENLEVAPTYLEAKLGHVHNLPPDMPSHSGRTPMAHN